jgi:protein-tyrosine-phosphatase
MAEALFKARLQEKEVNWRSWRIESAGTWAVPGQPASLEAQQNMERRGLDISQHRSRLIDAKILEGFELILTMEAGQKEAIQIEFPAFANRIYLLSEMNGEIMNINDPFGGSWQDYETAANEIDLRLLKGLDRICRLANGSTRLRSLTGTSDKT